MSEFLNFISKLRQNVGTIGFVCGRDGARPAEPIKLESEGKESVGGTIVRRFSGLSGREVSARIAAGGAEAGHARQGAFHV